MKNPYVIGEKIFLRPLEESDAPLLVRWFNDPEVIRTLRSWRPVTLTTEIEHLQKMARSQDDLVLGISLHDDRLIGVTGLHGFDPKNRAAMFGIVIGETNEWGKGFGTEATALIAGHGFETMNLHRIWLEVYADNLRGIRAYEKAGFIREGLARQTVWRDGRWHDCVLMGLLQEEWRALPARRAGR